MSDTATSDRPRRGRITRYLARFDDGEVMRWAFRGLLAGTICVLALDLKGLYEAPAALDPAATGGTVYLEPALPPALRPALGPEGAGSTTVDPRDGGGSTDDALREPIRFVLGRDGVMQATGTIDIGAAQRFAEEVAARGEYVEVLSMNSPGGSLDDALEISRLVRERGMATRVDDGAICASSCPLVLAGGETRQAGEKAAVGLHQFYAVAGQIAEPAQAMSDAQSTTARISRHLAEMDVDPALWLHALDTPPQSLYYLTLQEMRDYRLVTGTGTVALR